MTKNAVLEEEKQVTAPPSVEKRLEDWFPSRSGEFRRDIKPLWKNRYRINFWAEHIINRSYFIKVQDNRIFISPDKGEDIEVTQPIP